MVLAPLQRIRHPGPRLASGLFPQLSYNFVRGNCCQVHQNRRRGPSPPACSQNKTCRQGAPKRTKRTHQGPRETPPRDTSQSPLLRAPGLIAATRVPRGRLNTSNPTSASSSARSSPPHPDDAHSSRLDSESPDRSAPTPGAAFPYPLPTPPSLDCLPCLNLRHAARPVTECPNGHSPQQNLDSITPPPSNAAYRAARANPASIYCPPPVCRQWIAITFRPGFNTFAAAAVNGISSYPVVNPFRRATNSPLI